MPEAERYGCWEHKAACLAILPDRDGALPFRAVPPLDEEPTHPAVLVVRAGARFRLGSTSSRCVWSGKPNRRSCGGGVEGDREVEELVEDPGPTKRWAMQSGGARLPLCYRSRNASAGCGKHKQ